MEQCHLLFDIDVKLNVTDKPVEDLMKLCCVHIGPQLDWDPDIVAGLDVDFDYDNPDNVLEDDFVTLAEGPLPQNAEDNMDQEFEWETEYMHVTYYLAHIGSFLQSCCLNLKHIIIIIIIIITNNKFYLP